MAAEKHTDICFLTSRSLCPIHITQEWINRHVGIFGVTSVSHFTDKLPVLQGLKPTAYIDDHEPTIAMLRKAGLNQVFLADQPYNAGFLTIDIDSFIDEVYNGRI